METILSTYGKKLGEFTMTCPFCGGELVVTETQYDVPGVGPVLIVNRQCKKCGYKKNEVVPLKSKGHKRVYFHVEKPEDYRVKVIRSPFAKIMIPELGLEMRPGIDAEMFITNVEGIIYIFKDILERMDVLEPSEESKKMSNILGKILEKQNASFTLIIDDREGLSSIEAKEKGKLLIEIVS